MNIQFKWTKFENVKTTMIYCTLWNQFKNKNRHQTTLNWIYVFIWINFAFKIYMRVFLSLDRWVIVCVYRVCTFRFNRQIYTRHFDLVSCVFIFFFHRCIRAFKACSHTIDIHSIIFYTVYTLHTKDTHIHTSEIYPKYSKKSGAWIPMR